MRLVRLLFEPAGNVIGFHPEERNYGWRYPHEFLPAQPGIGKVIYAARLRWSRFYRRIMGNDLPETKNGQETGPAAPKVADMVLANPSIWLNFYDRAIACERTKEISTTTS